MVERVAKAIWLDRFPDQSWEKDATPADKLRYRSHARAAMSVMKRPTDVMLSATEGHDDNPDEGREVEVTPEMLANGKSVSMGGMRLRFTDEYLTAIYRAMAMPRLPSGR